MAAPAPVEPAVETTVAAPAPVEPAVEASRRGTGSGRARASRPAGASAPVDPAAETVVTAEAAE